MKRVSIVHLTDTLETGGAERVAVNLSNMLATERGGRRYDVCLCSTRRDGPLSELVAPEVHRLRLDRAHAADIPGLRKLIAFNQQRGVNVLHAHATSIFVAAAAAAFAPFPAVVWHDHFGSSEVRERPAWMYRSVARRTAGVIAVNERLGRWAVDRLGVPPARVWYVPNFVTSTARTSRVELPGQAGYRVVSVANFRPQKDHLTMLAAFALVARAEPRAHLILVGSNADGGYRALVDEAIRSHGLEPHVTVLGERHDVADLLPRCDVGLIGSRSEGLPLAVLEYGVAGLAVVSTRVGQLGDVLENGNAGVLVPSGSAPEIAAAVLALLAAPERRADLGKRFQERVASAFSADAAARQLAIIYDTVLGRTADAA